MATERITISKYAYVDDDSLVIYTNDFTLGNKIDFNTDVKIDDESFIANYEADSQGQVLTLFLWQSSLSATAVKFIAMLPEHILPHGAKEVYKWFLGKR